MTTKLPQDATIAQTVEYFLRQAGDKGKPVSLDEIGQFLKKHFPRRKLTSMQKTVANQLHWYMPRRGVRVTKEREGRSMRYMVVAKTKKPRVAARRPKTQSTEVEHASAA